MIKNVKAFAAGLIVALALLNAYHSAKSGKGEEVDGWQLISTD